MGRNSIESIIDDFIKGAQRSGVRVVVDRENRGREEKVAFNLGEAAAIAKLLGPGAAGGALAGAGMGAMRAGEGHRMEGAGKGALGGALGGAAGSALGGSLGGTLGGVNGGGLSAGLGGLGYGLGAMAGGAAGGAMAAPPEQGLMDRLRSTLKLSFDGGGMPGGGMPGGGDGGIDPQMLMALLGGGMQDPMGGGGGIDPQILALLQHIHGAAGAGGGMPAMGGGGGGMPPGLGGGGEGGEKKPPKKDGDKDNKGGEKKKDKDGDKDDKKPPKKDKDDGGECKESALRVAYARGVAAGLQKHANPLISGVLGAVAPSIIGKAGPSAARAMAHPIGSALASTGTQMAADRVFNR